MKKVYCKNCKYYDLSYVSCLEMYDKISYNKYSGYTERTDSKYIIPKYNNKNGNCKYYKRKWWKFWV